MKLSIITPHFNDFKGIQQTHECLKNQTSTHWEWIIVDDYSDNCVKKLLKKYFKENSLSNIKLIFNNSKTNASECRNLGVDVATNNTLVFLDADDIISEDFVANRLITVNDLVVFKNFHIKDENGITKPFPTASSHYLEHFLQAKFIWQTTAFLWSKDFLNKIGKFNADLKLLEDIELSIRALLLSKNYKVLDNKVDFYYCVAPIDTNKRPVHLVCDSVNYLITYFSENYTFTKTQKKLVKGFYFMNIRYLERSESVKDIGLVLSNLRLFHKKRYIGQRDYMLGVLLLKLYARHLVSPQLFLRINRYLFKPKTLH